MTATRRDWIAGMLLGEGLFSSSAVLSSGVVRAQGDGQGDNAQDTSNALFPSEHGQIWREYDLSAYVARVSALTGVVQSGVSDNGEGASAASATAVRAITEWVIHETGPEIWCGEAISVLSATPQRLRVYHTPQVQQVVAEVVSRFTALETIQYGCRVRFFSVSDPQWRTTLRQYLASVSVQNTGVMAWTLNRTNASSFDALIQKQSGFRTYFGVDSNLVAGGKIGNIGTGNAGQGTSLGVGTSSDGVSSVARTIALATGAQAGAKDAGSFVTNAPIAVGGVALSLQSLRNRGFIQDAYAVSGFPGYEQSTGTLVEGFTAKVTVLPGIDYQTMDAALDYEMAILDKMSKVGVNFTSPAGQKQQVAIEVPQIFKQDGMERFRWPIGETLLLSLGLVPPIEPENRSSLLSNLPIPRQSDSRVELLVELDCVSLRPAS